MIAREEGSISNNSLSNNVATTISSIEINNRSEEPTVRHKNVGICKNLLQEHKGSINDISNKNTFIGIGLSKGGIPIDLLTLVLALKPASKATLLIADEFALMNGNSQADVQDKIQHIQKYLRRACKLYDVKCELIKSSEIMNCNAYSLLESEINERLRKQNLISELKNTLPDNKSAYSNEYALHEIIISEFLAINHDAQVKLGPIRETLYDDIMRKISTPLEFAYAINAYPLATKISNPVVHYVANDHGAKHEGTRILINEYERRLYNKIHDPSNTPQALAYLAKLANTAAIILDNAPLPYLSHFSNRKEKSEYLNALAKQLLDNIITPLGQQNA